MTPVSSGILYRIVEWFLTVLPVDASGRRVFDETLADWRREVGHAQAWDARVFVAARSSGAVLRGLALVIGVLMLMVMGWAVPVAGQAFREITFIRAGGVGVVPSGRTAAQAVFQLHHGLQRPRSPRARSLK